MHGADHRRALAGQSRDRSVQVGGGLLQVGRQIVVVLGECLQVTAAAEHRSLGPDQDCPHVGILVALDRCSHQFLGEFETDDVGSIGPVQDQACNVLLDAEFDRLVVHDQSVSQAPGVPAWRGFRALDPEFALGENCRNLSMHLDLVRRMALCGKCFIRNNLVQDHLLD